ncbi:SAM-dependent methyltransferase [Streptomyces sp. ICC1]|nr:SAM-dependent methyltransferase [Streptomyces sp. ICC4]AWZ13630.1 SAM-dependent methyltransferase [Streptomyces sp. ICC1]
MSGTFTMRTHRLRPWQAGLYHDAIRAGRGPLFLRGAGGRLLPLEVERWCARADLADLTVLHRCAGTVLDIGCGPGRLVAALPGLGHPALGIDVSPEAVARTARSAPLGGRALCRSVFDPLPDEGRWHTALLIDGNIGIGGDPRALLGRISQITAAGGLLLVETAPGDVDDRMLVRMSDGRSSFGTAFPWARLGVPALLRVARETGWVSSERWRTPHRSFVALRRAP